MNMQESSSRHYEASILYENGDAHVQQVTTYT